MQEHIIKSPNDINSYKALTLDNGLRVLLVSQCLQEGSAEQDASSEAESTNMETESTNMEAESTEMETEVEEDVMSTASSECEVEESFKKTNLAAATLCVNVGTFSDPDDLPGLAHFLEHMVSMGSEKYPGENAYESFISSHGGSSNAWTNSEHTTFVMDVVPKHFKEALDLFANCFAAPLLRTESMDREIKAVDSEFSLSKPNDSERKMLLLQRTAKEGHPISKFMCGNVKSLKEIPAEKNIDVNEALHQFYKNHYSAEHMTLAVQSLETLDTLEEWVREIFSAIPNLNVPAPSFEHLLHPFDMEKFHKLYKVVPVKDFHEVKLTWPLPPCLKHYKSKPVRYIEWLVGHEGKGSITAYLRKKFWAVSLTAGCSDIGFDMNSTCTLFCVSICLTELGLDNLLDVIVAVFQYFKILATEGPQKHIFDEMQTIADADFRFQELEEPYDYVYKLSLNMQLYPCNHYLIGGKLFLEYDEKTIQDFLNEFSHTNVNITVLSSRYSELTCTEVEPWTECKFSCEDIPSEWIAQLSDVETVPYLHLPEPNKFIATDFELKHTESENEYPYMILETEQGRLWFKDDATLTVPKAHAYFHIITPVANASALNKAMSNLYIKIMGQILCEEVYPAEIADVYPCIQSANEGYTVLFWGFNHKLLVLMEMVLNLMAKFEVEKELFDAMKHQLKLKYYNTLLKPQKVAEFLHGKFSQNIYWSPLEKRNALESVSLEMLKDFVKKSFSTVYVEGLVQGNITKEEALQLNAMLVEKLHLVPCNLDDIPSILSYKFPLGEAVCRVTSFSQLNLNSVITNYYQLGPRSLELLTNIELLMEFMEEPCFDKLRTNEQLGYAVHCFKRAEWNSLGFSISVHSQSTEYSCSHVDQRIEEFLKGFLLVVENMSEDDFQTQLNSLIEKKKQTNLNLREETDCNWCHIVVHTYAFDMKEQQVCYLEKLQLETFKAWLQQVFPPDVKEHRKLSIQVHGPKDDALKDELPAISEDSDVAGPRNNGPMFLHFLPACDDIPSTTYISNLDDFISSLEVFPKYISD